MTAHADEAPAAPGPDLPTIVDLFRARVREAPTRPALRFRGGDRWETMTWQDYGEAVQATAAGLVHLGIRPGDRVAIMSNNRWAWHVADLATMSVGAATVPVYQTSSSSQVAQLLSDSGARACFVEDADQLAKVLLRRHDLPHLDQAIAFDPPDGLDDPFVLGLAELRTIGARMLADDPELVDRSRGPLAAEDLATLVYTSGTTGMPKGTMLSHGNLMANLRNVTAVVPIDADDRFLSFLPLSHIAERTVSHFGQILSGGETWFAERLSTVPEDIRSCRPTIFFAVPRVWEKLRDAVVTALAEQPRPLRALADRMLAEPTGHRPSPARRIEHAALQQTVGRLVRHRLGLDQARFVVSGAAPISPDLLRWFDRLGLTIAEVYGQTEGCGVTTLNPPGRIRFGTVGLPVPGVELRIADDGEVLVRGRNVTAGYHGRPEDTRQLVDAAGWMHTGDLGSVDAHGYLTITGRKKDLIITSSGKNIAPQEIELRLRDHPLVAEAVVAGDDRPYLVALLTLDPDAVAGWAQARGKLADLQALRDDPDLLAEIGESVEATNAELARVEQIKRWRLLPHELTMVEGELTPTLKVKRQLVLDRNRDVIDQLYAG